MDDNHPKTFLQAWQGLHDAVVRLWELMFVPPLTKTLKALLVAVRKIERLAYDRH